MSDRLFSEFIFSNDYYNSSIKFYICTKQLFVKVSIHSHFHNIIMTDYLRRLLCFHCTVLFSQQYHLSSEKRQHKAFEALQSLIIRFHFWNFLLKAFDVKQFFHILSRTNHSLKSSPFRLLLFLNHRFLLQFSFVQLIYSDSVTVVYFSLTTRSTNFHQESYRSMMKKTTNGVDQLNEELIAYALKQCCACTIFLLYEQILDIFETRGERFCYLSFYFG